MLLHQASVSEIPIVFLTPATPLSDTYGLKTTQRYREMALIIERQTEYNDSRSSRLGHTVETFTCQPKYCLSDHQDKRVVPAPYMFNQSWTLVYQVIHVIMEGCCYDLAGRWLPGELRAELGARSHCTRTTALGRSSLTAEMATCRWPIRPRLGFNFWAMFWRKHQAHLALRSATESPISLESLLTDAWLTSKMFRSGPSAAVHDARSLLTLAMKLAKAARDEVRGAVLKDLKGYIDRKVIVVEILESIKRRKLS